MTLIRPFNHKIVYTLYKGDKNLKRYNPYTLPPWLRKTRSLCQQFIIPFCIFQGIRTLLLPTTFDVLLLAILILIAISFHLDLI